MSQSWLQGFTYSYGGGDRRWRRLELFLTFKRYTLQRTYDECFIIFPPVISGSIKHHKQGNPVRPIVSSIGSALYNTSKFLTDILSPLQNCNGFSVPNSAKFAEEISNVDIQDDEVMLSFDALNRKL